MIQIIETNLMLDGTLNNFQSRVIEVGSWEEVIRQFTEKDIKHPRIYYGINGRYSGVIVPRMGEITDLKYDDLRLSCNVGTNYGEFKNVRKLIEKM